MAARLKYLCRVYLWTVVVFIIAKVVFMLCCREGHSFGMGDIWDVICHGLTLDLSTALYFLILPFLLVMISFWWTHKALSKISTIYFIIISIAFTLAFVADTSLYPFWNYKLDASCLQYLETPSEATASVSTAYLLVRLVLLVLLGYIVFLGYNIFKKAPRHPRGPSRIHHKRRAGLLLAEPVPEPLGGESDFQFLSFIRENRQLRS